MIPNILVAFVREAITHGITLNRTLARFRGTSVQLSVRVLVTQDDAR
jgi:hypothetical protein